MPGFRKLPRNKLLILCALLFYALPGAGGCSGAEESMISGDQKQLNTFLKKQEKAFNPSRYTADISSVARRELEQRVALKPQPVFTTALPETIAGFRAQVLFTENIEMANSVKDTLENLLPDQWCYIVYDAPYYKVRVGDFLDRNTATQMVRTLRTLGYKDPWVVPDNVVINIPPNPPSADIEVEPRSLPQK